MAWRKLKGKETGKEEKRNFQRDFSLSKFPQIKLIFGNINVSFFLKASVSKRSYLDVCDESWSGLDQVPRD